MIFETVRTGPTSAIIIGHQAPHFNDAGLCICSWHGCICPACPCNQAPPAAAAEFAETWAGLLISLPDAYGCHLTCGEAEAAHKFLAAHGYDDTAAELLAAHAAHDEPGDEHYQDT